MAAIASPAPLSFGSGANEYRRLHRTTRLPHHRTHAHKASYALVSMTSNTKRSVGDSSDEDDIAPIKLSAEAQAILEDNSQADSDKENKIPHLNGKVTTEDGVSNDLRTARRQLPISAPLHQESGSPAPRVIRVTSDKRPTIPTTLGRDGSFMYKIHDKSSHASDKNMNKSQTPEVNKRIIRVSGGRRASQSPSPTHASEGVNSKDRPTLVNLSQNDQNPEVPISLNSEEDFAHGPSTITRSRRADDAGIHSTMRVRRVGVGSFLGKPVRRGMIRRASEDEDLPVDQQYPERETSRSPEVEIGRRAKEPDLEDVPDMGLVAHGSPKMQNRKAASRDTKSPSPMALSTKLEPSAHQPPSEGSTQRKNPTSSSHVLHPSTKSSSSHKKPIFRIPSLPPLPSEHDQENEPPPTFKKIKSGVPLLQVHEDLASMHDKLNTVGATPQSPERQPLALRSNNTPHRPAPAPPPKMSIIDAATSNAGSRKKGTPYVTINDRMYRRFDCIGRGGSSRVFRIMAENFNFFAMKRVNLEDADMAAIAGYKGEIDLLKKLENVDRVVRLFDYEINEEKGLLHVMMELGESDFNKILNDQLKADDAKLDITFTRHYWKELLECVAAIHEHDIVHSDLKPQNFLLVKGVLKLIDFGIANAIQGDTVNVHRENQIGTPNYMSPESLVCETAVGPNAGRQFKLGKPSDVWSLGCMLYQMTYGQPPFAHINGQMQRIMAIPNPKVEIQFPTRGIGGSVVPFGLIKTLRRCLTREQSLRPTIAELLSDNDPFLYPVSISPEMLGRVIGNVVSYCRRREDVMRSQGQVIGEGVSCLPKDKDMEAWPLAFYEKLRQAQDEGTAW